MIFEREFNINYSETDYKLALKPSALLNFLQNTASDNAEELGFGYTYTTQKNLMWFLIKYRMEFNEYPVSVHKLKIHTEPRGCNKLFAYRDFWIYDDKKLLGKVASTWSVVDTDKKNIVPAKQALNSEYMQDFEKREDDLVYNKIKIPEKIDISKKFDIRYDDIDVNKHANNENYIIWALEPLGFDFQSTHKIKTLDIQFKKEIKYGEEIVSNITFLTPDKTCHVIKNARTNEELCLAEILWS